MPKAFICIPLKLFWRFCWCDELLYGPKLKSEFQKCIQRGQEENCGTMRTSFLEIGFNHSEGRDRGDLVDSCVAQTLMLHLHFLSHVPSVTLWGVCREARNGHNSARTESEPHLGVRVTWLVSPKLYPHNCNVQEYYYIIFILIYIVFRSCQWKARINAQNTICWLTVRSNSIKKW